ncbi:HEAT repeat-containing protein 1 [Gaertneriomyces sp. JEL0708]|nr:HEAT repeat-containing protein 1 [Gaertneriomyces sp. JEL0708]
MAPTTLESQLRQLAQPRVAGLGKGRASLLFAPKKAADIDADTIFSIGRDGLADLVIHNRAFADFEHTLFSDHVKSLDRTLQSAEDNAKLDASISKFLRILSPYLLQPSSFKALEWLLRRFRINEFNVDAVLECILPYHETKQFAQIVSLLVLEETSRWAFLKAIQKNKVPLDRATLVQRCMTDPSLLVFICEMIAASRKAMVVNKTLWSFFLCTLIQYFQTLPAVSDMEIRVLLPPLLSMLRIGNPQYADLRAAAQMVISAVAKQMPFSSEIFQTIVENVTHGMTAANIQPSLMFLLALSRSQSECTVSEKALRTILALPGLAEAVIAINRIYQADQLIRALCYAAVNLICNPDSNLKATEQAAVFAETIAQDSSLPEATQRSIVSLVVDSFLSRLDAEQHVIASLQSITRSVRRVHAVVVDKIIEDRLRTATTIRDARQKEALYEFVSSTFKGTRGELVVNADTTLFLSLNHADVNVRLTALIKLKDMLEASEAGISEDLGFLQDLLVTSLADSDDRIVSSILDSPRLLEHIPVENLSAACRTILRSELMNQRTKCLAFEVCSRLSANADAAEDLIGCFLITKNKRMLAAQACKVESKADTLLAALTEGCKQVALEVERAVSPDALVKAQISILNILATNLRNNGKLDFYLSALDCTNVATRQLSVLVLSTMLAAANIDGKLDVVTRFADVLMKRLNRVRENMRPAAAERVRLLPYQELLHCLMNTVDGSAEVGVFLYGLNHVITSVRRPPLVTSWVQPIATDYQCLLVNLYKTAANVQDVKARETLLKSILTHHLSKDAISFCAALWTREDVSPSQRANSLHIACSYIRVCAGGPHSGKHDFQLIIPSLLMALVDQSQLVRSAGLGCMRAISLSYGKIGGDAKTKKMTIYAYDELYGDSSKQVEYLSIKAAAKLTLAILDAKEEILMDAGYLPRFLAELLTVKVGELAPFKDEFLAFLLSHVMAFPRIRCQSALLSVIELVDSPTKMKKLYPLLQITLDRLSHVDTASETFTEITGLAHSLIRCFTPKAFTALLNMKSNRYARIFCQALGVGDRSIAMKKMAPSGLSVQGVALQQIDPAAFAAIDPARQSELFAAIIHVAYDGEAAVVQDAKKLLKALPMSYELVATELSASHGPLSATTKHHSKKAKSVSHEIHTLMYRISVVLEMLEYKENVHDKHKLVGPLFTLLGNVLNADIEDTPATVEYVKQLILSVELSLFTAIEAQGLHIDEAALRVDLIVHCIRLTDNPQTHNVCLLLMAAIAAVYPESVLLNIMPVFTFMGDNVLRQDDNYSFHVIEKTLTTIIPPLIAQHIADGDMRKVVPAIRPILLVFVDALTHIPKHRRLGLFTTLASTLGPEQFLDAIILMLLGKHSAKSKLPANATEGVLEFTLSLIAQFPVHVQMTTLAAMIQVVASLPFEKIELREDDAMDVEIGGIFDPTVQSSKELRHAKLVTVDFANRVLASKSLIRMLLQQDTNETDQLKLVEYILTFIANVNAYQSSGEAKNHLASVKFCKIITKMLYEALSKANALLSLPVFMHTMSRLMKHESPTIRRKAINLLDAKVSAIAADFDVEMLQHFTDIVEDLRLVVAGDEDEHDEEILENKQTALLCLTTMAQLMARSDPDTYVSLLDALAGDSALGHSNRRVVASAMACITVICMEVESRMLPYLPRVIPTLINKLEDALQQKDVAGDLVILGALGSLDALVGTIPQFFSPYVQSVLNLALHPDLQSTQTRETAGERAVEKNSDLLANMARKIAPRILLPAMFSQLQRVLRAGRPSTLRFFELVGNSIAHMSRADLTQYRTDIFKFFLVSFDFRRTYGSDQPSEDVEAVENSIISAFLQLVMKLNETLFKPMFTKIVDWATSSLLLKHGLVERDVEARQIFLYRLVDTLLARLKSIFAPYYSALLDTSIVKLTAYIAEERGPDDLWTYITSSLHKFFLYDNDGLIDGDKFARLLEPLVSQMDIKYNKPKGYLDLMSSYLVPCLGQLAVTAGNDALWKQLNQQVLLRTRDERAEVRIIALKALQELYAKLGEEMLILFPETIPFLAELMEDDNADVEKLCQDVCAQIQQYIGEPIQQYFTA